MRLHDKIWTETIAQVDRFLLFFSISFFLSFFLFFFCFCIALSCCFLFLFLLWKHLVQSSYQWLLRPLESAPKAVGRSASSRRKLGWTISNNYSCNTLNALWWFSAITENCVGRLATHKWHRWHNKLTWSAKAGKAGCRFDRLLNEGNIHSMRPRLIHTSKSAPRCGILRGWSLSQDGCAERRGRNRRPMNITRLRRSWWHFQKT